MTDDFTLGERIRFHRKDGARYMSGTIQDIMRDEDGIYVFRIVSNGRWYNLPPVAVKKVIPRERHD